MKQIIEEKALIGKTILNTGYSDNTFMLYLSDDSFAIFRGCGWDSNDVELMDEKFPLNPTVSNAYELHDLGVITKEEVENVYSDYKEKIRKKKEEREKEEYERLKSKYGKGNDLY